MQFFGCNISNRKQLIVRHIEKFNVTWVKRGFGWPIFGLFLDWIDVFFANFARMNKTLTFILFLCVTMLAGLLPGCHRGGAPRYDPRLIAADSVLSLNDPDSVLHLLDAIDGDKLTSACDRAYHALLLTQAQYRCYVDITSDSAINVALDYYKRHDEEHEKLTRCYIYKGAVTEVLNDPEVAINYYKKAASVATPDDHFNLGYANLRIGCLYRDYLVADSAAITAIKEALHHFEQVPDSLYIMKCLSSIGGVYAAKDKRDSAIFYLDRADTFSKKLHQSSEELVNLMYLADLKMFSNDIDELEEAKAISLRLLRNGDIVPERRDHLLMDAANTLAKLNKPDSAVFYINQVDRAKQKDGLLVLYESCLAEIARSRQDVDQFKLYYDRANHLSDSLMKNDLQMQLRDMEAKYDNEALKHKALRYKSNWLLSLLGTLLAISTLAIALMVITRKAAERKRQIAASEETIDRLQSDAAQLASQLEANHEMNERLKATIRHQIDTFTQLVELHYTQFAQFPKKFDELFKKAYNLNQPDPSFWSGLRAYADSTCNGIITRTLEEHPSLAESDVRFLSLCCCNLPTSAIMACLGYNDLHSIYRKKRRLAKKIGLTVKLDNYIMEMQHSKPAPPHED